ncbi:hypothetical protein MIR68_002524 [Amoeboaphelidium protococcarum]|nr:hypothetical protein MIR68_002524 [Amoeboaphelidium protococcarum]
MSSKQKIVATRKLTPQAQNKLESLRDRYDLVQHTANCAMSRSELLRQVKGAVGLLCVINDKIDDELIRECGPQLKVVSSLSVGVDHIQFQRGESGPNSNVRVGYTPDVLTDACADLCVALLLAHYRRFVEAVKSVTTASFSSFDPTWMCGHQLTGITVGFFGMGRIGQAAAERLLAFGVGSILYTDSSSSLSTNRDFNAGSNSGFDTNQQSTPKVDECTQWSKQNVEERLKTIGQYFQLNEVRKVDFVELLQKSDVVIITSALNDKTRQVFNSEAFSLMKSSAVLINCARGGIVDTDSLVQALQQGTIAGAALDVTDPEPLPRDHPLIGMIESGKVLILPHISSATIETREMMSDLAVRNLIAGIEGDIMPSEYTS